MLTKCMKCFKLKIYIDLVYDYKLNVAIYIIFYRVYRLTV